MQVGIWGLRFAYCCSLTVLCVIIYHLFFAFPEHPLYQWQWSTSLSQDACQAIQAIVQQTYETQGISGVSSVVYQPLALLTAKRHCSGVIAVQTVTQKPLRALSGSHVITDGNNICTNGFFSTQALTGLPTLWLNQPIEQVSAEEKQVLINWALHTESTLFKKWKVLWHEPHVIDLQDRVDQAFFVRTCAKEQVDESMLKVCLEIKNDLIKRRVFTKQKGNWIADIRFDKQIIVMQENVQSSQPQRHSTQKSGLPYYSYAKYICYEKGRGMYGPNIA